MAVHKLTMVPHPSGQARANPLQCREHFGAGRLPVYYGRTLVAYVDGPMICPKPGSCNAMAGSPAFWTWGRRRPS